MTAIELLQKADIIRIDGYLLHNWEVNELKDLDDENDIALNFSYTDSEGLIFSFEFTFKEVAAATIVDNNMRILDTAGQMVEIDLFKLTPFPQA